DVIPLAVFDMVTDFNGKLKAAKQAISRDVASLVKSRNPAAHSFSLAATDEDIQEQKNRCTYVRQVASEAYKASMIIVHTMATSTAVLCGCVFTPVKSEWSVADRLIDLKAGSSRRLHHGETPSLSSRLATGQWPVCDHTWTTNMAGPIMNQVDDPQDQ
ncbi:hypothetical protein FOZ63_005643, partial [Perkinsus olseni]